MAELFAKCVCTNCQEDIQGVSVRCAECTDFDLCLQCFAVGVEIGPHKNDHSYQFMDSGVFSIFRGKGCWTAREELHLLNAVEKFNFGNWEDISKHIETKSPEDAKEEYVSKFLNGTIGRHTWLPALSLRPNIIDHTENDTGPLSQEVTQRLPPLDVTNEEAEQLGYMPNRDDYEKEYDPCAEQLISSLTLNSEDDDVDIVLKLAQFDIYTRRLRERARRKRQVRDYQLIANFFRGTMKRSRCSREQRELRDRFRVFAQFYTSHEFERILSSLERQKALRVRLSELNRYRWNGLTKTEECIHFEQHAASAQSKNTGPYGNGRTDQLHTGEQQMSSSLLQVKREGEGVAIKSSNFTEPKYTPHIADQAYYDASLPSKSSSDSIQMGLQNVANLPGGQLLTSNEIQLCSGLNLPPTQYISLKTVLLSGATCTNSHNSLVENQVKNFLVKVGWLKTISRN